MSGDSNMEKLRWGVMSTAKIAREKVIPGIRSARNAELVAIASRQPDSARRVADDLAIPTAHGSYEDMLADDSIDAVYIPLPNHMHLEWTERAARAGKHVLCEKPLGLDAAEARRMHDTCAAEDVVLLEAFMYRFHPQWQAVFDLVRSGRIGELRSVQSWFSYFNDDPTNIRNVAAWGGGALMDIGCYCIHLSRSLFGREPLGAEAIMKLDPHSGVDILTSATLDFGEGTAGFTVGTRIEPDQRVHIYGTEGRIEIEIPFNIPADRQARVTLTTGRTSPVAPHTEVLTFDAVDHYGLEVEAVGRAVINGDALVGAAADSADNMAVIDQLFASAR